MGAPAAARPAAARPSRWPVACSAVACAVVFVFGLPLLRGRRPVRRSVAVLGREVAFLEHTPSTPRYAWRGAVVMLHDEGQTPRVWDVSASRLVSRAGGAHHVIVLEVPLRRGGSETHGDWLLALLDAIFADDFQPGSASGAPRHDRSESFFDSLAVVAARKRRGVVVVAAGDSAKYAVPLLFDAPDRLAAVVLVGEKPAPCQGGGARMTAEYFDSQFAAVHVKVAVIVGERDQATPVLARAALVAAPKFTMRFIAQAGVSCHVERPKDFADALAEYLLEDEPDAPRGEAPRGDAPALRRGVRPR